MLRPRRGDFLIAGAVLLLHPLGLRRVVSRCKGGEHSSAHTLSLSHYHMMTDDRLEHHGFERKQSEIMIIRFVRLLLATLTLFLLFYAQPLHILQRRRAERYFRGRTSKRVLQDQGADTLSLLPTVATDAPSHSSTGVIPKLPHNRPVATFLPNLHTSINTPAQNPPQPIEHEGAPPPPAKKKRKKIHHPPSPYAYIFYATSNLYACSALVNIARLQAFRTPHPIHLLASPQVSQRYLDAFTALNVTIHIQTPPPLAADEGSGGYYEGCLLKLLAFRIHEFAPQIKRVIILDSD